MNLDKGARLISFLQNLEKLTTATYSPDDYHQLRYITSRILQHVSTPDKAIRDIVLKNADHLDRILYVLEHSLDKNTTLNLVYVLSEVVGRINNGKRLSLLVSHGATQILLHVLINEAKQADPSEDLLIAIHQLISKVGLKDRKLCIKARLYQALGVSLNLLRNHSSHPKILQPVVHVLKLYAADAVNASFLGKNGAVTYLFKVFNLCQRKHLLLLRQSLDTLGLLVKSKSNAARAVGHGGISILLSMFGEWHRLDAKHRHIGIRKAILTAIKNIANIKSGREAFVEADGVRILYESCEETKDCRELEPVIYLASIVMRKCFPRNHLPVPTLKNPIFCPVPVEETAETSETVEPHQGCEEVGYESSLDNDDDVSSDDDRETHKIDSDDGGEAAISFEISYKRSFDDLLQYKEFFPELYEYDDMLASLDPTYNPSLNSVSSSSSSAAASGPVTSKTDIHLSVRSSRKNPSQNNRLSSVEALHQCHTSSSSTVGSSSPQFDRLRLPVDVESHRRGDSDSSNGAEVAIANLTRADVSPKTSKKLRSPKSKRKASKSVANGNGGKLSSKSQKSNVTTTTTGKSLDDWSTTSDSNVVVATMTASSGVAVTSDHASARAENVPNDDDGEPEEGEELTEQRVEDPKLFAETAASTRGLGNLRKLAYPDLHGHCVPPSREALYEKKFATQRQRIFEDIDRFINPDQVTSRVIYDLDAILEKQTEITTNLINDDEERILRKENESMVLSFNSLFESGNLRSAIQIRPYEYDLILNPDINTNRFHQWFYFEVGNMEANVAYRFNIINCEKMNSQFNFGMRPVMFSVSEAMQGRPYWFRAGTKICYYKNHFVRSAHTTGGLRGKTYYTASFTISFRHEKDVCYLAYHYPYTYTTLRYHLKRWQQSSHDSASIYFKNQTLCQTITGNVVPLLTITSHPLTYDKNGINQMKNRPYIFLTSRVHPGESNASWVMKGTIEFLLSDHETAKTLRDTYIFKIVPMLNPDGVINGNHRCSMVAEDLNRRWFCPSERRHPTIFHTKGLLQFLRAVDRSPFVFCDYHGHSRRKNVFLYGCSPSHSWIADDLDNPAVFVDRLEDTGYKTLPKILHNIAPSFSLSSCSFVVERVKETTARVVVWRQIGVVRSYTMESTYCGCDQGPYKGRHINTRHLQVMGRNFAQALVKVKNKRPRATPASGATSDLASGSTDSFATHIPSRCDQPAFDRNDAHESASSLGSSPSDAEDDVESEEQEQEDDLNENEEEQEREQEDL